MEMPRGAPPTHRERNAKDVSNLNVLSLIKNAVNDTTGLISGQRVMCDFVFFSLAYIDSESGVDAEYFALGAMGSWRIVDGGSEEAGD